MKFTVPFIPESLLPKVPKSTDGTEVAVLKKNAQRLAAILILGTLTNPIWGWMVHWIYPQGQDPLSVRLLGSLFLAMGAMAALVPRFWPVIEEVAIISMLGFNHTLSYLVVQNNYHSIYLALYGWCLMSTYVSVQRKWSVYVLSVSMITSAIHANPSHPGFWIYSASLLTGAFVFAMIALNRITLHEGLQRSSDALAEKEKHLLAQNQFIRQVTQSVPTLITVFDANTRQPLFVNGRIKEIFGILSPLAIDLHINWLNFIHKEDAPKLNDVFLKIFNSTPNEDISFEVELRVKHSLGHYVDLKSRWTVFTRTETQNVAQILAVCEDVSHQKQIESDLEKERARILYTSKMSTLGEMAGGIAHEINNPLAIIGAYAEQLADASTNNEAINGAFLKSRADKIRTTVERIAAIIKGLRAFARDGSRDSFSEVSLNQILSEARDLCQSRFLNHNIALEIEIPQSNILFQARGVQISQVILNLLNNAFDAVCEHLTHKPETPAWVKVAFHETDSLLVIRVTDSGPGIPEKLRQKIMEPFYTTKELGKGTGLGLSISDGIARSHQGRLYYDINSPNTSFVLELPKKQTLPLLAA